MSQPRIAFLAPQYGAEATGTIECAQAADRLGLEVWLAGQMMPMPASNAQSAFEPFSAMGAIAAVTEKARLGFMALAVPYLPPLYVAKALLTLDELSGGRIEAGLGAGWRREEFEALEVPFEPIDRRLAAIEQTLEIVAELCGPPRPEAERRWPADARASSSGSMPPVWIAGMGPKVLGLAAKRADWTNFAKGISVEDFTAKGEHVKAEAARLGRQVRLSLTATYMSGERDDLERRLGRRAEARGISVEDYVARLRAANVFVGTPDEIAVQMRPFIEAGSEAFVLWPLDGRHRQAVEELAEVRDKL